MAGNAELGKAFLDELLSKLPEAARASVSTALSSPEAAAAHEFLGSRVSPLDEERRQLHEQATALTNKEAKLTDWQGRLTGWKTEAETKYAERERKIAEREAAGGGGGGNPNPNPPAKPAEGTTMTEAQVEGAIVKVLEAREPAFIQYVADATKFATFHLQQFNETLDVLALVRHPKIGELGLPAVYELVNKEKLDTMREKAKLAERETLKRELRAEILTEQPVDMPYPIASEGSPLDALLLPADKRPKGDPVAATRLYESLVSGGAGR